MSYTFYQGRPATKRRRTTVWEHTTWGGNRMMM